MHGRVAGILEAMLHADGDVGRLILAEQGDLVAARHPCGAAHNHPMLRALVVILQREPTAGLHYDVLDLHTLAVVDRAVTAPRALDERVALELASAVALEPGDELLQV